MTLSQELVEAIESERASIRSPFPLWLRPMVMREVDAITLGRRIYIREEAAPHLDRLVRHELEHVRQIRRQGILRFYLAYLFEYGRNRVRGMSGVEAYRAISFEREAEAEEQAGSARDI